MKHSPTPWKVNCVTGSVVDNMGYALIDGDAVSIVDAKHIVKVVNLYSRAKAIKAAKKYGLKKL